MCDYYHLDIKLKEELQVLFFLNIFHSILEQFFG